MKCKTRVTMTLRRVRELLLPWKRISITFLSVCVCVCVFARACSLAYQACNAYAPYCDVFCGASVSTAFFCIIT
jgi:hypothetical protein